MGRPPNEEGAPFGAPSTAPNNLTAPDQRSHREDTGEVGRGMGWRDLLTERPQPSPEMLASPTLGAWLRANGVTGWSDYAKVYFATLLVEEAQRRILLERLDGIMQFLAAGATPDQAIDRLGDLVDEYHGRGTRATRGELAA